MIRAKDGLAKDIGVSNHSTDLIDTLIDATGETPIVNRIEWSPFGHRTRRHCFTARGACAGGP